MFYNETPSASGQTLTFDVNPQPGDVIQFVSPITNISTEAYTAAFSTGGSFPIMYGGEELVQAYLLYSGQTYLAVFTGNGLEITAQQAADAQGNTVNTAPYVINTFLDPAYSGLLTEQMQVLASLTGDSAKPNVFTVPVTMTTGLSVTGDMSISSGRLTVADSVSAAPGTSDNELVNYTQMTDSSLSPTFNTTTTTTQTTIGNQTIGGYLKTTGTASAAPATANNELISYFQLTDGSLNPSFNSVTLGISNNPHQAIAQSQLGNLNGFVGTGSDLTLAGTAYGQAVMVANGAVVTLPSSEVYGGLIYFYTNGGPYSIVSNSDQFIYSPQLGMTDTTGPITLNCPNGEDVLLLCLNAEFAIIGGSILVTQAVSQTFANPLSVPAGTTGTEVVNYAQMTDGSFSPTFGNVVLSPATKPSQAVAYSQLGNLTGVTYTTAGQTLTEAAYGQAFQVAPGVAVTLPTSGVYGGLLYFYSAGGAYSIVSNSDQFIYSPQLGMTDTTGPTTLNCPNGEDVLLLYHSGEFDIIGGSILVTQAASQTFGHPLSVPAGTTGTEVVNYAQTAFLTEKSLSATTTAGNQTITAAQMIGSYFADSATQTAAYSLTTDTAANLLGALPAAQVGTSFTLRVINNDQSSTGYAMTLAAGSGVTISTSLPNPSVGKGLWADYLCTFTAIGSSAAVTVVCVS